MNFIRFLIGFFAFFLLCSESSLYIPVNSCQICGWRVFRPSLYLIFSSSLQGFWQSKSFEVCWSSVYQFFLLWTVFLLSSLGTLWPALHIKDFLPFSTSFIILYFTFVCNILSINFYKSYDIQVKVHFVLPRKSSCPIIIC